MALNPNIVQLDPGQIIKRSFDGLNDRLRVDAEVTAVISGAQEVIINHTNDSIRLGDGTDLTTTTTIGSDVGLDVNVINGISQTGLKDGIKSSTFTVTDSAAKLPSSPLSGRNTMSVRVIGTNTVYFGGSTVSTINGYPKFEREEIQADIQDDSPVELWAVCESGKTCEVRILEIA